jgi:hypothetical protein
MPWNAEEAGLFGCHDRGFVAAWAVIGETRTFRWGARSATIAPSGSKRRQREGADMDREGQVTTDGRALAEQLGRVGLW